MIISDCHLHSQFSGDSQAPMASMVESAVARGMKTICFTEHIDYDYPSQNTGEDIVFLVDMQAYRDKVYEMKEKYSGKIEILFGIELGMMPYLSPRYEALVKSWDFDFVIQSSHLVDGKDPYFRDFLNGRTEEAAYRSYFETIIKNMDAFHDYDTYAHLDYVVRYGPNENRNYSYDKYADILEPTLKHIIESGRALEVNTGGYKYGLGQPHPHLDVLKQFKAMGGELITIGSDAHAPEHVAFAFETVENVLTALGFKYYSVYKNRKPVMYPLG